MINRITPFFGSLVLTLLLYSCNTNSWDIDIDNVVTDQEFKRFDKTLFELDVDSIWDKVPELEIEYQNFFEVYNSHVIQIGGTNQLDYDSKLVYFLTDPDIYGSYLDAQKKINIDGIFNEISDAFKRYKYYYPNKIIPNIYTHISGFNQSIIIDSNYLSIALDKYLGTKSKYYKLLRTPKYIRANMHAAKIPSDVIYSWVETEFTFNNESENLANKMIYYGKLQLFLDAMLPQNPDTLKWGFSEQQLKWCNKNEAQMWLYLVENKLLFSSAFKDINKYINDGPFTSTFSQKSPARTGRWMGYQIVKAYLKENPEVSLQNLMDNNNYQQILSQSKYKP